MRIRVFVGLKYLCIKYVCNCQDSCLKTKTGLYLDKTTQMSSRSINQFDRRMGGVYCFRHRSALSIGDSDFGRKRKEKRTCFSLVMGYRFLKGFLMVVRDLYIYGSTKILPLIYPVSPRPPAFSLLYIYLSVPNALPKISK